MNVDRSMPNEPIFVISIASRIVGIHAQTLRYYERVGLVSPSRTEGRQRLYSPQDIEKIRRIRALTEDMGVNLAGVEVILKLMDRLNKMEKEMDRLTNEVKRLRASRPDTNAATQEEN